MEALQSRVWELEEQLKAAPPGLEIGTGGEKEDVLKGIAAGTLRGREDGLRRLEAEMEEAEAAAQARDAELRAREARLKDRAKRLQEEAEQQEEERPPLLLPPSGDADTDGPAL